MRKCELHLRGVVDNNGPDGNALEDAGPRRRNRFTAALHSSNAVLNVLTLLDTDALLSAAPNVFAGARDT